MIPARSIPGHPIERCASNNTQIVLERLSVCRNIGDRCSLHCFLLITRIQANDSCATNCAWHPRLAPSPGLRLHQLRG